METEILRKDCTANNLVMIESIIESSTIAGYWNMKLFYCLALLILWNRIIPCEQVDAGRKNSRASEVEEFILRQIEENPETHIHELLYVACIRTELENLKKKFHKQQVRSWYCNVFETVKDIIYCQSSISGGEAVRGRSGTNRCKVEAFNYTMIHSSHWNTILSGLLINWRRLWATYQDFNDVD